MSDIYLQIEGDEANCWTTVQMDRRPVEGDAFDVTAFRQCWRVQVVGVEAPVVGLTEPERPACLWATIRILE